MRERLVQGVKFCQRCNFRVNNYKSCPICGCKQFFFVQPAEPENSTGLSEKLGGVAKSTIKELKGTALKSRTAIQKLWHLLNVPNDADKTNEPSR